MPRRFQARRTGVLLDHLKGKCNQLLVLGLSFKFAGGSGAKKGWEEAPMEGSRRCVKLKNFQVLYPFNGYVIESVDCGSVGMQINLGRDRRCALTGRDFPLRRLVSSIPTRTSLLQSATAWALST
jgi:hypothetical protein